MSLKFTLKKHNIESNKSYGKWYAHTLRGEELSMDEIEKCIQENCSATRADVKAVLAALHDVVLRALKDGRVVSLGELGKLRLSIRSECVDRPDDFSVQRHVKGVVCKYTPDSHRDPLSGRLLRPFTDKCRLEQISLYDAEGHLAKRIRRGGWSRKRNL